ncbi:MAG TPA: ComEC/Rec2 family competence protein [Ramlibacter sp.]|nr:ComEC/Rec2 family competence protein [Ramlibacter sp.]
MPNSHAGGRSLTPALLGVVFGSALQLQQPALWGWQAYALMLVPALAWLVAGSYLSFSALRVRAAFALPTFALVAFALCGLRSVHFAAQGLDPALEGRDIVVTGVVAAMPQRNETGLRFRLEVESASMAGAAVRIPPQLYLGWYGGVIPDPDGIFELQRQTPELHAGERWRMTLRLKAPHGNSNPHGFDYELWLWEQGLQATGYVRSGPRDTPPQRLGGTWWHPVERARQDVRDRIFEHVADRKTAGLIAALVVGDQNAIDLGSCNHVLLTQRT